MSRPTKGFTPVPHDVLEALVRSGLPGRHLAAVLHVLRETNGWNRDQHKISAGQVSRALGIDDRSARRIVKDLEDWQVIRRSRARTGFAAEMRVEGPSRWRLPGRGEAGHGDTGLPTTRVAGDPGNAQPGDPGSAQPGDPGTARPDADRKNKRESVHAPIEPEQKSLDGIQAEDQPPRVLHIISKLEGKPDEKLAWWRAEQAGIEAWAEANRKTLPQAVLGWYRAYLRKYTNERERPFWDADAKAQLKEAARRLNEETPKPPQRTIDLSKVVRRMPSAGGRA